MADIFDPEPKPSALLCDESKDLCFDHHHHDDHGDEYIHRDNQSPPCVSVPGSESSVHFLNEEGFSSMLEREKNYLPKQDYLSRLRCGELDLDSRREAFDWITKAHSYYSFGPLSLCLAVNYLDRILSICDLPKGKAWAVQLLAVACLSIAAKVEETSVPQSIELQVGDPKFMFEAKTIERMERLVLDTLDWKMNAVTPCSFLDYTLKKLSDFHNKTKSSLFSITTQVVNRSMQLIFCTLRGIDFLEFKPSEISAAVAIFVSAEFQAVDFDNPISCFNHLAEDRVMKCLAMMKAIQSNGKNENNRRRRKGVGEISLVGVLDGLAKTRVESSCPKICCHNMTTNVRSNSNGNNNGSCSHGNKRKRSEVEDPFYL